MRLFKTGENEQNAYYKWVPGGQKYVSWKDIENNKTIVVSKSVQNTLPDNIKASTSNCGFIANPIKHPRKQYVNLNIDTTGFSKQSYIGSLDKPGGTNITTVECDNLNQIGYEYILNLKDKSTCREKCFITKPATTVIDSEYSASNKALLWKRCKTINQNLPLTTSNTNLTSYPTDCSTINNCTPTFNPSNTKYQVQGPLSSSARIAAIRYCAQDVDSRRCKLPTTDYNRFGTTDSFNNIATMPGCTIGCRPDGLNKKYSNIRILQ
jgi:hypothetical protein